MLIKLEGPPYIYIWRVGDISKREQRKLARATERPESYTTGGFWAAVLLLVIAAVVLASFFHSMHLNGWLYYIPVALLCFTGWWVWGVRVRPVMARRYQEDLISKGLAFPEGSISFEMFVRGRSDGVPRLGYHSTDLDIVLQCFWQCEKRAHDEYWFLQKIHTRAWNGLQALCDEWGVITTDRLADAERKISLSRESELNLALESAREESERIQSQRSLYRFHEASVGE